MSRHPAVGDSCHCQEQVAESMNIYIPIEVKKREIEGRTLLALAAAERGHVVVLGGKEDTLGLAGRGLLKPGILHLKTLQPSLTTVANLKGYLSRGHVITSQDEESGMDRDYEVFARTRYSAETCSMASRIACWGPYDARTLRDLYGRGNDLNLAETGSPRVDFWRPEFSGYYARQQKALKERFGSYVLVSSNFGAVLNVRRFWDWVKRLRDTNHLVNEEAEYALYRETGDVMCILAEFVRMIRALAAANPGTQVIVRPHPVDAVGAWRGLLGDCPGVVVTREGTLGAWLRGAKVLIHNGCTSGLEAAVCGVPRIAYVPVESEFERKAPNAVSLRLDSLAALLDAVDAILHGRSLMFDAEHQQGEQALLRQRFSSLDGALASDRIVDEWEQLSSSSLEGANDWMKVRFAVRRRQLRAHMSRVLSSFGRGRPKKWWPSLTRLKFPPIKDSEISTIVSDLKSFLGRFEAVGYERLGERSFIFRSS